MEQTNVPPASEHAVGPTGDPKEIALSAVWQEQGFVGPLRATDGRGVEVISRGTWTHGFGPDFRDALIAFDGYELRAGSVEVHLASSSWYAHGHDRDPRYNDVILHVVLTQDRAETRRADGGIVPIVVVGELLERPLTDAVASTADWSRFGGEACAPALTQGDPATVRQILLRLGDARLASRAARLEARLTAETPAQVLYESIWDGLGYHQNRGPMRLVAQTVPLADLERLMAMVAISDRLTVARGILLGVAGFLPLSPTEASFGHLAPEDVTALEAAWRRYGSP